jgi:spermidine synthase
LLGVAIAVFSGMAALTHQLIWTRRLIDLLGGSQESAVRVFGTFFFGLAIGSALAAWLIPGIRRPVRWLAAIELLVILFSLPAIFLPWWSAGLWEAVGTEILLDWRGNLIKLGTSVLVIFLPSLAMGFTLPLLCLALLSYQQQLDREGIWLYAANTLGGMLGLLLTSLLLLEKLGVLGTLLAAVGISWLVIGLAIHLDRNQALAGLCLPEKLLNGTVDLQGNESGRGKTHMYWIVLMVSFLSGWGILSYEVLALQLAMLVAPLSFYAPAAILTVIIGLLAAGALITPVSIQFFGKAENLIVWALSITGCLFMLTPIWFLTVVSRLGGMLAVSQFETWLVMVTLLILISIGPAIFFASFVFPAVLAWLGREKDPQGKTVGWLLAINGLGGLLGAELGYQVLLPQLGLYPALGAIGIVFLSTSLMLGNYVGSSEKAYRFSVIGLLLGLFLVFNWLPKLPLINPHLGFEIIAAHSGREGTLAVVGQPGNQRAMLLSNQYLLGSTAARWDQERQAHLPLMLHPNPQEVAVIGLATGITAGAVLQHSNLQRLAVIELSPVVIELAADHFSDFHGPLFQDPRTKIINEDGRIYMAAAQQQFDLVIGDLFLPWGPGEGRLFTKEHFRSVHDALKSGGVYCQWLPMFQLTDLQFQVIAETFQNVFPEVHLLANGFHIDQPAMALVGFRGSGLDWDTIESRILEVRRDRILDPLVRNRNGLASVYLGQYNGTGNVPHNSLDNLWIELNAGRLRVVSQPWETYLVAERWLSWLEHNAGHPSPIQWAPNQREDVRQPPLFSRIINHEIIRRNQPLAFIPADLLDWFREIRDDLEADRRRWPGTGNWLSDPG